MPVRKEEVYHLKNWEFLIDFMCFAPDMAYDTVVRSFENTFGALYPEQRIDRTFIKECSCARTREGLEACMILDFEGMHGALNPRDMQPNFDKFLKILDDEISKWKELWYDYHSV